MLEVNIPAAQPLRLSYLILDYNGTLACDGSILPAPWWGSISGHTT